MRRLEENLFMEMVKSEVEASLGLWTGSLEQNRRADTRISNYVKTSFKVYEKTKQSYEETYFNF